MKLSLHRPRVILILGDDGIVVTPYRIGGATPFFVPHEGRQSAQEIIEFIARHPTASLTLMVDNLAQDFRSDTLPHLNPFDRAKLIQRRLKQNFPAARLTASLRGKHNRAKELLIGLHESNLIFVWAERLRTRLPTISFLPIEGTRIIAKLMPEATTGWAMMISRHKSGGFRQIVTLDNELIFTRLTPLPDRANGQAEIIAQDIKASLDYLSRQGLRNPTDLSVLLLLPGDIHTHKAFEPLPLGSLTSLSPYAAAQKLGLAFAAKENDSSGDLLFAASYFKCTRPALSLMLPDARQTLRTQQIRHGGICAASLALFLALSGTAWNAADFLSTALQVQKQSVLTQTAQQNLAQAQATAAPVTEPLGRLRQALERRRIFERPTATPWRGFTELATEAEPHASLTKIDWRKDSDASPETISISLRMTQTDDRSSPDRANTVAAFAQETQYIARAMPDFDVVKLSPPYPASPQDAVNTETPNDAQAPVGQIIMQRKKHD